MRGHWITSGLRKLNKHYQSGGVGGGSPQFIIRHALGNLISYIGGYVLSGSKWVGSYVTSIYETTRILMLKYIVDKQTPAPLYVTKIEIILSYQDTVNYNTRTSYIEFSYPNGSPLNWTTFTSITTGNVEHGELMVYDSASSMYVMQTPLSINIMQHSPISGQFGIDWIFTGFQSTIYYDTDTYSSGSDRAYGWLETYKVR